MPAFAGKASRWALAIRKLVMKRFLKWVGIIVLLALVFSCLGILVWFYNLDAPSGEKGSAMAQPIIDVIEIYHQRTGAYPSSLQELVPDYLKEVPKPDWRNEYRYALTYDHRFFYIGFIPFGDASGWFVYSSCNGTWTRTGSGMWMACDDSQD
jgi:hypothetical protein